MSIKIMVHVAKNGKTVVIDAEPGESMASLLQKISDREGVEKEYIHIVYDGHSYRHGNASTDHKSIAEIGLKDRSLVQLVARLPGGH